MMDINKLKAASEIISTWAGLIALIAGGFFGAMEYIDKKQDDRIRASMQLLDRLHGERLQNSYLPLYESWQRNWTLVSEAVASPNASDLSTVVTTIIDTEKLSNHVQVLIDFYEVVDVCVQQTICDQKTAHEFFHRDSKSFFEMHKPFIDRERKNRNDSNYACRLEQYVLGQRQKCELPT